MWSPILIFLDPLHEIFFLNKNNLSIVDTDVCMSLT